jgi:triphosphoribosyl-dephospho-CoA synthase
VADADDAFRAIALANPGGLGSIDEHDVQAPARIDLRAAMRLAADRDLIARQYANDGADLFDIGLRAWRAEAAPQLAMQRVYLEFLARFPDSHIMRKHGIEAAQAVLQAARQWRTCREVDAVAVQGDLAKWDAQLKSEGLNPGTSADLAVATAFLAGILASCAS